MSPFSGSNPLFASTWEASWADSRSFCRSGNRFGSDFFGSTGGTASPLPCFCRSACGTENSHLSVGQRLLPGPFHPPQPEQMILPGGASARCCRGGGSALVADGRWMWAVVSRGERVGGGGWGWGDGVALLSLHGAHEGGLRLQSGGRFIQAGHRLAHEGLGHPLRPALVPAGDDELALGHILQLRQILLLIILCGASVVGARRVCACAEGSGARAQASPPPSPPRPHPLSTPGCRPPGPTDRASA